MKNLICFTLFLFVGAIFFACENSDREELRRIEKKMKVRNEIFEGVVSNIYGCFDRALARKNATGFTSNDSLIDSSWKIASSK